MKIDSPFWVVLGSIVTVAAVLVLAFTWDRRGLLGRSSFATTGVLAIALTALFQVNRMVEAYPSWEALSGQEVPAGNAAAPQLAEDDDDDAAGSPAPDDVPVQAPASPGKPGTSSMLKYAVAGPASRLTLPMYVYLPPGYSSHPHTRYPVIEATHGFPGTNAAWLRKLHAQRHLDAEIAAGRMAPTVVVFPMQTPRTLLDTECTDMAGTGPKTETYLTVDVPAYVTAHFHVRTDRAGWGLIGYSAGGFCSSNLVLRHPDKYASAASLSGYDTAGIAVGDGSEHTTNDPAWRLQHLPQPWVSLYLAWADDDKTTRRDSLRLAGLAHAPMQVTTAVVAHGGHSQAVWEKMEAPAFDWLSAHLAREYDDTPSHAPAPGNPQVTKPDK